MNTGVNTAQHEYETPPAVSERGAGGSHDRTYANGSTGGAVGCRRRWASGHGQKAAACTRVRRAREREMHRRGSGGEPATSWLASMT
jgi:hypothetical protein